jgi:hypothetical protein
MIKPGTYRARAIGARFSAASTGTEQIAVDFELLEGEPPEGRITWWGFFTPRAQAQTLEALRNAGCVFPADDVTDLTGLGETEVELVVIAEETDSGAQRPRVRWVNRLAGAGNALEASQRRALATRLRGAVMGSRPTTPPSEGRAARAPTEGDGAHPPF